MESASFNIPGVIDDFNCAVVHIAVVAAKQKRLVPNAGELLERPPLRLLFASIWLLAPGRQIPLRPSKPYVKHFYDGSIAVDRIIMTADAAVSWYRSPSEQLHTPIPLDSPREKSDGIPLSAGRFSDFPRWPSLGVPMDNDDVTLTPGRSVIPFRSHGIIRYSRRISDSQKWPSFLDQEGQSRSSQQAFKFLEHHMHVDFREYPEYMGGMTLGVPDSEVLSIRQFVDPKTDGSESLYFHLKPHLGRKLQGLTLTSVEGQEGMLTSFESVPVPEDGLVEIKRPSTIYTSGLILQHKDRGVLMHSPMRQFMRQMNFTMEVVERKVRIQAPETDKKKSPLNEYISEKKTAASSDRWGEAPDVTDAFQRLQDAKKERRLNDGAKLYDQTWFAAGQRKEALDYIREKLRHAYSTVFIADPYFSVNQITQYLFAIEREGVKIEILTSTAAFKPIRLDVVGGGEEGSAVPHDSGNSLSQRIKDFQSINGNTIEVKVANTEDSLFHDRFLAVDGRVWMLGSSMNSIGARPTLIMRVPHGEKILSHLTSLYENADSLENLKFPSEPAKKVCIHCGRDVTGVKQLENSSAAKGLEEQSSKDFNDG